MWPNPQETADLITFNEEILNEKLHFLCSAFEKVLLEITFGKIVIRKTLALLLPQIQKRI